MHRYCCQSAVFAALPFCIKSIALRYGTPLMLIQFFKIFHIYYCILTSRQANTPEGKAIALTPVKKRNANQPICQRRTDFDFKVDGNDNFDWNIPERI
jgi:hypothetical protein